MSLYVCICVCVCSLHLCIYLTMYWCLAELTVSCVQVSALLNFCGTHDDMLVQWKVILRTCRLVCIADNTDKLIMKIQARGKLRYNGNTCFSPRNSLMYNVIVGLIYTRPNIRTCSHFLVKCALIYNLEGVEILCQQTPS